MIQNGFDALYINAGPNMRYFSGWSAYLSGWPIWLSALIVPAQGEPVFFLSKMHHDILKCSDSWLKDGDVRTYMDGEDVTGQLREVLQERGLLGSRLGVEDNMWHAENELLALLAPTIRADCAGVVFDSLRRVKDAGEIEAIRRANDIATFTHQRAAEVIREGVAEYEAGVELLKAMFEAGADTLETMGLHGHFRTYLPRRFQEGDVIDVDMSPRWDGYATDYARNVFVGQPSEALVRAQQVTREASYRIFEMVKPGIEAQQVHRFASDFMQQQGYDQVWKIGHGVGLAPGHEAPLIQEGESLILEPGMVFTIDPGCFVSGQDRDTPIHIEDCVVVTETGCEILSNYTRELVVV
jgi:Xaa-Pro aminopeptidase